MYIWACSPESFDRRRNTRYTIIVMETTISENVTNIRDLITLARSLHLESIGSNLRKIYSNQVSLKLFNTVVIVSIIIIIIIFKQYTQTEKLQQIGQI